MHPAGVFLSRGFCLSFLSISSSFTFPLTVSSFTTSFHSFTADGPGQKGKGQRVCDLGDRRLTFDLPLTTPREHTIRATSQKLSIYLFYLDFGLLFPRTTGRTATQSALYFQQRVSLCMCVSVCACVRAHSPWNVVHSVRLKTGAVWVCV